MKIVQVVESLTLGDAVANDAVAIDELLKQMDVCGGIYVANESNIHKRYLHSIAEPISQLPELDNEDLLLFHHAIANDFCYQIPQLLCRKVLIYHNITPPQFFEGIHEGFRDATQRGLDQLQMLNKSFDACIADSEFNKQDLEALGYEFPIHVCPVLVPFEDYTQEPNKKIVERYSDGKKNILFVGRLSPNKKQEDVVHAFCIYKKYYDSNARLFLVGSDGVEEYGKRLRNYIAQLGVKDVIITGSIPFKDILAYYAIAHVFVCMSEHEGFCVPLIEAMFFNVPILAFESCAIPYTLGDCAVTMSQKNYPLAAGWIYHLAYDEQLRENVIQKQRKRLEAFSYENVAMNTKLLLNQFMQMPIKDVCVDASLFNASSDDKSFVLVMPIKASDWDNAQRGLALIKKNLRPRKIVIISSAELEKKLSFDKDLAFIDENRLVPKMTFSKVKKVIANAGGEVRFTGWYLQQFLKLGFSRICTDKYYLVWDADTIPLNYIPFFDQTTGKPYFNLKREYAKPYFDTMDTLLGLKKCCPESFITEHMIFDTELCKRMLIDIESNAQIAGDSFWEKCIYGSNFTNYNQTFSEYETFGTYVMSHYPEHYETRKLRTFRCGMDFVGATPSEEIYEWCSHDFDTLSLEHWSTPIEESALLCANSQIRQQFSFKSIVQYICKWAEIQACIGGDKERDLYQRLLLKQEFDFFFGSKTKFE